MCAMSIYTIVLLDDQNSPAMVLRMVVGSQVLETAVPLVVV